MMVSAEWDVVVVGGANTDFLVLGPRLPTPGESVMGERYQSGPGGKGANQAVAAARLGARVAFIGRVGDDDRGSVLIERLRDEGVDTRYIERDAEQPTGVALVQVNRDGEKQILAAHGANAHVSTKDIDRASHLIARARVLLACLEVPVDVVDAAARIAKASNVKVVLDPAPPTALSDDLLSVVDLIKPNAAEAHVLTGIQPDDQSTGRAAAEVLMSRGVGAVAIGVRHTGNLLLWRDGEEWLPHHPVRVVDETGAGDAFAAASATTLAWGWEVRRAGTFASATAALATTALGAQSSLPKYEAVVDLLRQSGTSVPEAPRRH